MKIEKVERSVLYAQERALPLRQSWNLVIPAKLSRRKKSAVTGKVIFDAFFSSLGIMFSSPIWLLIGAAILAEDGWPVFYRQDRVGKHGKTFAAIKFRTMRKDAEEGLGAVQALKNDPRITRVGNWLRKTALDELPQLWNILIGEMSFTGPRPLRPGEILAGAFGEEIKLEDVPGFHERVRVTPGLTGLAQIYAPRNIHHRQKFRYDLLYIKTQSFWLDIKLIVMSLFRSLRGNWEA